MGRKLKLKPVITRVKLNPEQAVLSCTCFDAGVIWDRRSRDTGTGQNWYCNQDRGVRNAPNQGVCGVGTGQVGYRLIASAGAS